MAPNPKGGTMFRAQTFIAPDRMAALAKEICQSARRPLPGGVFIRFEGALPGRLFFTIRRRVGYAPLMSFCIDIGHDPSGLTTLSTWIQGFMTTRERNRIRGYGLYKKCMQSLGEAMCRFDPHSVGILVERC